MEIQRATGREPELLRHRAMLDAVCRADFSHPQTRFSGRGIVICAGGERYLPSVYVLVRLLRHLRCTLPVEVWHLGPGEMPDRMRVLLGEHGAVCVDAEAMRRVHPARRPGGWELKCYVLLHCSLAEVLLLDADNCPVNNDERITMNQTDRRRAASRPKSATPLPRCMAMIRPEDVIRAVERYLVTPRRKALKRV